MLKKLLSLILALPVLAFGQATTGYHRVSQIIARGPQSGVTAQVVPNATIYMTVTATGLAAAIYSDPLLTMQITGSTIRTDTNGNYSYYVALGYCVNENISYPGSGSLVVQNICGNTGSIGVPVSVANGGTGQTTAAAALANLGGVSTLTTVNGNPLSGNIVISASQITTGTLPHAQLPTLLSGDIPNNAANTSGSAASLSAASALPSGTTAPTQTTSDSSALLATGAFVHAVVTAGPFQSLTTTGNNGAASLTTGVLNIPNYSPVADTTVTVSTTTINANACGTMATVSMPNLTTGMTVTFTPSTDFHTTTGWNPSGSLYFFPIPTSGTLDYYVCNPTGSNIIPGGSTVWNVSAK